MDWLGRAAKLGQWTGNGIRAPHKPLLLAEYGPANRTTPAHPFHYLVSDGVWDVRTDRGPDSPGTGMPELRATGARRGGWCRSYAQPCYVNRRC